MKTTIVKIEGNKIQAVIDNDIKELELESWVKPEFVKLGEAEITIKDNKVSFVSMQDVLKPSEQGSTKKSGKWEDDMVTFEDLLTKAHELKAPFSIKTEMLAIDLEKKYALFKATVEIYATDEQYKKYCIGELSEESKHPVRMLLAEFTGHGDATDSNVTGEFIKPHFIRMAETRAIVRALRWYTNNGCAEEEK